MAMRSGGVPALQRQDFSLDGDIPTVKVEHAVKQFDNVTSIGPLKTARRRIATRTLPIPAVLVADVRAHLRNHAQLGRNRLLL